MLYKRIKINYIVTLPAGDLEVSEIMAITGHKTEKAFYKYIRGTPKETALRIKDKFIQRELKQQAAKENYLRAV